MKHKITLVFLALFTLSILAFPAAGFAQENQDSGGQNTEAAAEEESKESVQLFGAAPQGYKTNKKLQTGTVVQGDPEKSDTVIPATQDRLEAAFGLVVDEGSLPIQLSGNDGQAYVATSGRHTALVTNENGTIQSGDFLVVSSLSGTLMKSSAEQELIFAKALSGFDGKNNIIGVTTLQDEAGNPIKEVGIGTIPVAIEIIKNPEQVSTETALPNWLERVGVAVAEKEVSAIRIYIGTAIITLTILIALTMLYIGVRTALISVGRNPLSKKSIFRGLLQVILTSVLVLIIGLFTVYLLLRL